MSAPIALFVYARPDHTRRTVEALLKNEQVVTSDIIVFSDAAINTEDQKAVENVRKYCSTIEGFQSVKIHHRPYNFGLAKSIIEGVTQVLTEYDRLIVVEDDLVTSPYFLKYMNDGLNLYENDDRVVSLHGYVYPTQELLPEAFFLRGADCWGWATWRRGWASFNPDGQHLLDELKRQKLVKSFDFHGAFDYSGMLQGQINGTNNSWAVRWYASAFLANKLTLYPGRSLVHNIGNDSSGTHCGTNTALDAELSKTPIQLNDVIVEESTLAKKAIEGFFRSKRASLRRVLARVMPRDFRQLLSTIAKDWLPPALARQLHRLLGYGGISFEGPFPSWEEAVRRSSGYDSEVILEKVLESTLKVKHGEAVFERDSVLFDEIQYAWPATAGLMWAAACNGGRLSVLDLGGSLGSSYFQNRKFLQGLGNVRWSVVEQPHFVEAGRKHIQDETLAFYPTISECVATEKPNVVLLSSVLQYLDKPYEILEELVECGAEFIVVDRTSFQEWSDDLIAVQEIDKSIYPASYPLWVFSKYRFNKFVSQRFEVIIETLSPEGFVLINGREFSFNGFMMRRKYIEE